MGNRALGSCSFAFRLRHDGARIARGKSFFMVMVWGLAAIRFRDLPSGLSKGQTLIFQGQTLIFQAVARSWCPGCRMMCVDWP